MDPAIIFSFLVLIACPVLQVTAEKSGARFEDLFQAGVDSYLQDRWFECYSFMKRALQEYKSYQNNLAECRLTCNKETQPSISLQEMPDLAFYESAIKRSNCVRLCKQEKNIVDRRQSTDPKLREIVQRFENYDPYNYLQICAYQSGNHEDAAAAAYTFLTEHPDHEMMQSNIAFYRTVPEIRPEHFQDLEAKKYQTLYSIGVEAYNNEQWKTCIENTEEALLEFFRETDKCEAMCEGHYELEQGQDLYNAIADQYVEALRCKSECERKLSTYGGVEVPNYLAEHYNYLQFSYYQINNVREAAKAAETYLMLIPDDAQMLGNRAFYLSLDSIQECDFIVRQDAKQYHERRYQEANLLVYVQQHYLDAKNKKPDRFESPTYKENKQSSPYPEAVFLPKDDAYEKEMKQYQERGIEIIMEEDQLQGKNRVAVDGLLTEEECQQLSNLAEVGATQGDGYKGTEHRTSPHTDYEIFEGLTVSGAAEGVAKGKVPMDLAYLYLRASETSRVFLNKYYNLKEPMYFHYTHLVCRTALQGHDQTKRADLSHPVHSDNCHIQPDGSCPKERPAYIERDFSALLYLNEDFEGGDFFFAHDNLTIQQTVRPKCGRMVGFESGVYHGVEAVTKGRRCAVAMWFTMNYKEQETSHAEARTVLKMVENKNRESQNEELEIFLEDKDISIIATEEELNGPERFAVDGMMNEEECQTLMDLANTGGVVGDGYSSSKGRSSPHTNHEKFAGVTVGRAAELAASDMVTKQAAELYLDVSEKARHLVETYFSLESPLYFDYTHLVCRTAIDPSVVRKDLSHPIHSDNCIIQADNSCLKKRPAYIQRDYSALIYLNDEFTGGEFFFAHQNMTIQSSVRPHCGEMVAFNATNYHGVKAVLSGQRCAVAIWFTLDPIFSEVEHVTARNILENLSGKPRGPRSHVHGEL